MVKNVGAAGLLIGLLVSAGASQAQKNPGAIQIRTSQTGTTAGFRALSVVNDSVAWVGGSQGHIGCTRDEGKTWKWFKIPGADSLDFRGIVAVSPWKVLAVNAGAPACIFLTTDGGAHWKNVYINRDTAFFLDGISFYHDREGLVYGDPVGKKSTGAGSDRSPARFVLLRTKDGGSHWKLIPFKKRPLSNREEASFAASNSALATLPGNKPLWFATGGATSRVFHAKKLGRVWKSVGTPVLSGKSSTGIFSMAFLDKDHGICVGGDYAAPGVRVDNAAITQNGGQSWQKPLVNPFGYRSSVIYFSKDTLLATGPSGTDLSVNGGVIWKPLCDQGFNVLQKAPGGKVVYLAGADGRMAVLSFPQNIQERPPLFEAPKE